MERIDKFDGSKFKFEYLKGRELGRFFITDKDGEINIFDMPVPELMELYKELEIVLAEYIQRKMLIEFVKKEVDPVHELDTNCKFGTDMIDEFLKEFNQKTKEDLK